MRRSRPLILTAVAPLAALSLLAAGCGGGGGSPGVASVGSSTSPVSTSTSTLSGFVAFGECMASHGVPNFPAPGSPKSEVVALAKGNPAKFNAAQQACVHLLPNESLAPPETAQQIRTKLADSLSFARCMRSRGVSRFPDPTAQGDLTTGMVEAQGIDLHSPAVLRAVQACIPASHGGLTMKKVSEAISHADR
jgi:hypothetical protein